MMDERTPLSWRVGVHDRHPSRLQSTTQLSSGGAFRGIPHLFFERHQVCHSIANYWVGDADVAGRLGHFVFFALHELEALRSACRVHEPTIATSLQEAADIVEHVGWLGHCLEDCGKVVLEGVAALVGHGASKDPEIVEDSAAALRQPLVKSH